MREEESRDPEQVNDRERQCATTLESLDSRQACLIHGRHTASGRAQPASLRPALRCVLDCTRELEGCDGPAAQPPPLCGRAPGASVRRHLAGMHARPSPTARQSRCGSGCSPGERVVALRACGPRRFSGDRGYSEPAKGEQATAVSPDRATAAAPSVLSETRPPPLDGARLLFANVRELP